MIIRDHIILDQRRHLALADVPVVTGNLPVADAIAQARSAGKCFVAWVDANSVKLIVLDEMETIKRWRVAHAKGTATIKVADIAPVEPLPFVDDGASLASVQWDILDAGPHTGVAALENLGQFDGLVLLSEGSIDRLVQAVRVFSCEQGHTYYSPGVPAFCDYDGTRVS